MNDLPEVELDFFAVRNKEGQWFRRKGYGGSGNSWVDDIKLARIYGKIGGARAIVTFFAKNYPQSRVPEIVKFKAVPAEVINEEARVKKIIAKKEERELESRNRRRQEEIERLQKQQVTTTRRLERLRSS